MSAAPLASIVVVAWGRREVTGRCLESLDAALGADLGGRFELVLVDNASPDDTLALFDRWRDRARVVALADNRNFAGGCNAGARAASGEVLVFLNNDTVVPHGALEALAEAAREPGVGAVGCRLLYPDGLIQHAGVGMVANGHGAVMPHHLFLGEDGDQPAARASFDVDVVTAACVAVPRELFTALEGFDERYVNGFEDVDLCLRLRVAGHRVHYRGDIALTHDEGQTRGPTRGDDGNAERFHRRWGHLLDDDTATLGRLFDAEFAPVLGQPVAGASADRLVVSGQLTGLAPDAAEARALLRAAEAAGLSPVAGNRAASIVGPRLGPEEWALIERAHRRTPAPAAGVVQVPQGPADPVAFHPGGIARVASVPRTALERAGQVWASSPALVELLGASGLASDRIRWVPPALPAVEPGAGGGGVLVLLPAHDRARAETTLDAVAALGSGVAVRVVPSVRSTGTERLVSDRLPGADLLDPCSDERRFAALAASADAVLCLDPADAFERRALLAAAAGAAPVTRTPGGPAAAVLGAEIAPRAGERLGDALARALGAGGRGERAARVAAMCSEAALGERLAAVVTHADAGPRRAALTG